MKVIQTLEEHNIETEQVAASVSVEREDQPLLV